MSKIAHHVNPSSFFLTSSKGTISPPPHKAFPAYSKYCTQAEEKYTRSSKFPLWDNGGEITAISAIS